jgi:hypothetical protein
MKFTHSIFFNTLTILIVSDQALAVKNIFVCFDYYYHQLPEMNHDLLCFFIVYYEL